jgi:hypothetical protein
MSIPAFASELDELKAMILQLRSIEQLENQQKRGSSPLWAEAAEPAKPVIRLVPGSFLIPGTDTSLKIYGNVRVDATYDFATRNNDINNNDWSSAVFAQPLDTSSANRQRKNQLYATARASRFGIVTSTPSEWGDLEVKLEGDFNAPNDYMSELGSNGTQVRLRHAYGRWGNLLGEVVELHSDRAPIRWISTHRGRDPDPPDQLRYTLPLGSSSGIFRRIRPVQLASVTLSMAATFRRTPILCQLTLNGESPHSAAR